MLNPGESEVIMVKDTEVEVCSEEDGFVGAWFRAILEENTTKKGRKRIRCRYLNLLSEEDCGGSLVEMIEQRFIRPVPKEEDYGGVVIEEGVVVDADHKDGWWTGVVINEVEGEEFLVSFEVPPDVLKFEKKQLRAHLDWNGWKWNVPHKKELDKSVFSPGANVEVRSAYDKAEEVWVPMMVVKKSEVDGKKKILVKDCNELLRCNGEESGPNRLIDARCVRPTPPPFTVESFKLLESVEALHGTKWRQGLVIGVLSDRSYIIRFETKEEQVYKLACLRPLMVWQDGAWHDGPKRSPIEESPSKGKKKKSVCSSSTAKPITPKRATMSVRRSLDSEESGQTLKKCENVAAAGGLSKKNADTVRNDQTPLDISPQVTSIANESVSSVTPVVMNDTTPPVKTPQVTSIANEAVSRVTPSPVVTVTPLKPTEAETEGNKSSDKTTEPSSNQNSCGNESPQESQNGSGNNSTQEKVLEEDKSEDASRKRKRNEQDNGDLGENGETSNNSKAETNDTCKKICNNDGGQPLTPWMRNLSPELADHSPNVAAAATNTEGSQAKDSLMALPFEKKSPYWKTFESQEKFKSVPQRPHFSPLLEANNNIREWSAVGMMVTYYMSLDEVKALKLDDPSSKLCELGASFAKLEKYGFDTATPLARISKVLSLQDERAKKANERKCLEAKMEEDENEKRKMEEKRAELKLKILELQKEYANAEEMQEAASKRIVEMQASTSKIDQEMKDVEVECAKTISEPW